MSIQTIQHDFEIALAEADPSLPLCECTRWCEFQAGAAYAARQEAG